MNPAAHNLPLKTNAETSSELEARILRQAEWEILMRTLILHGDLMAVQRCTKKSGIGPGIGLETSSLRNRKDYLVSLNFIYADSAQAGGVPAVEVYRTYEQFQSRIEQVRNLDKLKQIEQEIAEQYCLMVIAEQTDGRSDLAARALRHIRIHYAEPVTLHSTAEAIHCSEGHLSRIFRRETGMTLREYLNEQRIRHAMSLLQTRLYPITDIALMVGFSSYAKFSVEFKRYANMNASEYLRRCADTL